MGTLRKQGVHVVDAECPDGQKKFVVRRSVFRKRCSTYNSSPDKRLQAVKRGRRTGQPNQKRQPHVEATKGAG